MMDYSLNPRVKGGDILENIIPKDMVLSYDWHNGDVVNWKGQCPLGSSDPY